MARDVTQFETLYWIARLGSFRAAAVRLGVSQPTVSIRIKEWERELGFVLFKRMGRSVILSDDGAAVLDYAERILELAHDLDHRIRGARELKGLVRFGVPDSFALSCLANVLRDLDTSHPQLKVAVTVDNSRILARRLEEGALDVSILAEPPSNRNIRLEPLGWHDPLWVAARSTIQEKTVFTPHDLVEQRIFTNPAPSNTFTLLMDWFGEHGLVPSRMSTCNSISVILSLVVAGVGISALPHCVVDDYIENGSLFRLRTSEQLARQNIYIASAKTSNNPSIPVISRVVRNVITRKFFVDSFKDESRQ